MLQKFCTKKKGVLGKTDGARRRHDRATRTNDRATRSTEWLRRRSRTAGGSAGRAQKRPPVRGAGGRVFNQSTFHAAFVGGTGQSSPQNGVSPSGEGQGVIVSAARRMRSAKSQSAPLSCSFSSGVKSVGLPLPSLDNTQIVHFLYYPSIKRIVFALPRTNIPFRKAFVGAPTLGLARKRPPVRGAGGQVSNKKS